MKDAFSTYHPAVNFLYFALVLLCSMLFLHPVCLLISAACAFAWSAYLGGAKALRFNLCGMLPMFLFAAVINPAFSHEGATILAYLPSGNPLTWESIAYGLGSAAMLVTVIMWFSCYNKIMTSDKFVYLFGRVIPALSLILSMTLRFVPKFKAQLFAVSEAQRCVGRDASEGSVWQRTRNAIRILSILVTWALENAIETADSMKSRGYGLPGRTAFSIYRFDERDRNALGYLLGLGALIGILALAGQYDWRYYPTIKGAALSPWSVFAWLCYLGICAMPLVLDKYEDHIWARLRAEGGETCTDP